MCVDDHCKIVLFEVVASVTVVVTVSGRESES